MKINAKVIGMVMAVVVVGLLSTSGYAQPAAPAKAAEATISGASDLAGIVVVMKDESGNVQAVKLAEKTGKAYRVALDENGKKLAQELAGKKAEVKGVVTGMEVKVLSFKAAEEPKAPAAPAQPKAETQTEK